MPNSTFALTMLVVMTAWPGHTRIPAGERQETAAAILRRAAAAYARVTTLRASFTMQQDNPLLKSRTTSKGMLYQRRPDRILLRFEQPEGDVVVSDGRSLWVYYPSVDPRQVLRAPAGKNSAGVVDLQAQFLGDPVARFDHRLEGVETVSGRSADVLTLVPHQDLGYRKLKIWVDRRDHLVRRFELTDQTGAVRRFELTDLAINVSLPDDLFHFTPPADAQVIDRG